jgi:hypothetical protein
MAHPQFCCSFCSRINNRISNHAQGLGRRRVSMFLAITSHRVLPSAHYYNVGTRNELFRRSMAGLVIPPLTLYYPPHGISDSAVTYEQSIASGQCGSLLLTPKGLAIVMAHPQFCCSFCSRINNNNLKRLTLFTKVLS